MTSFAARLYPWLIDPLILPLRPKIVRCCRTRDLRTVLDIASGSGAQCRRLRAAGLSPVGIDLSETMVEVARRRTRGVAFLCASALALPFPDGRFDASLLLLALHEHPEEERERMLREALRVLRADGRLLVADYTRPRFPKLHVPWLVICFVEAIAGREHRAGFRDFVRRGGLDGLIDRHGLQAEAVVRSHFGTIGVAVVTTAAARERT